MLFYDLNYLLICIVSIGVLIVRLRDYMLNEQWLDIDDDKLYCLSTQFESSKKTVVFIHGLGGLIFVLLMRLIILLNII